MSTIRFFSFILFSASLYAQLSETSVTFSRRSAPLLTASGELSIAEEQTQRPANPPISGVVSLRELQHSIPQKAIREAYEAQQLAFANKNSKAIAKLEKAIRMAPGYRDAHLNLGVEYARAGRTADARAEFQKALDIGPPAAPIYADLAFAALASSHYREAETLAHKALELDPANGGARRALEYASAH